MKLLIVESPSKAKTIEKYLGDDFKVLSSVGHIRELPKNESRAINIESDFKPCYEVIKGKEKVISQLKTEAKGAETIYLATDPDREGEAIAWHLKEVMAIKDPKRIIFNEITKDAVNTAIQNPRNIDNNLKIAQEARRVLDRLFGYTLSALIWKKVRYGLSAGRVQSPALRILMERDREIQKFKPTPFWIIVGKVKNINGEIFDVTGGVDFEKYGDAKEILDVGVQSFWLVEEVKKTKRQKKPSSPLTTSTLQQQANSRLLYSPANTMRIAQKLYEAGAITYMRTDSTRISEQAHKAIKSVIENIFGSDLYERKDYVQKKKNVQDAHEAIRPTDMLKKIAGKSEDEQKLYSLIWSKTIASQMVNTESLTTNIKLVPENHKNKAVQLVLKGSQIMTSREYVSNSIRLLSLEDEMIDALQRGIISEGHARPLLMLSDRKDEQRFLFDEIMNRRLTVRDAERVARRIAVDKVRENKKRLFSEYKVMEDNLSDKLGATVYIESNSKNEGKILINFSSHDNLNDIYSSLNETNNKNKEYIDTDTEENQNEDEDLYSNFSI